MLVKAYIAFSIHGSNTFLTATKLVKTLGTTAVIADQAGALKKLVSRRPDWKPEDGIKLGWAKLNKADGTPHTNPGWVLRRFNELEKAGWKVIGKEKFIQRHFKNDKKDNTVSRRQ